MRINIAKVRLVKSIGGLHCELLLNLIAPFLFFKFLYKPKFMTFRESHFQNSHSNPNEKKSYEQDTILSYYIQ